MDLERLVEPCDFGGHGWTDPDRLWTDYELPCDAANMDIFRACVKIHSQRQKEDQNNWLGTKTPSSPHPRAIQDRHSEEWGGP